MSAKLDIFNDIVTEIKKLTDIKTIELWNNQLDNEDREVPFNYPAVFIEFANIFWTSTNQKPSRLGAEGDKRKEQKGEGAIITIHIAFSQLENETISFPIIDAIIEKVYFAIQSLGEKKNFYGPLLRVAERQDTNHDRVIDWQMDFMTTLFQCGEIDTDLQKISAGTLGVDVTVDLDIDNETIRSGDGTI